MTENVAQLRLFKAVESMYRAMEPFRKLTTGLTQEYAGSSYGQSRTQHEIIINVQSQAAIASTMNLVGNQPRALVSSANPAYVPFAKKYQLAINRLIQEIGLEQTIRNWVLDAYLGVGLIKVHMADSFPVQIEQDLWADPGQPFASNIALENFVCDMSANKWSEMQFAGDWYRLPLSEVQSNPAFENTEDLKPTSKVALDDQRLSEIARGVTTDEDELEPMVDLCDLWIPRKGVIETYALDGKTFKLKGDPLAVMPWTGHEFGPYKKLGFYDVPENIMPTSPASMIAALSRIANNIARKQKRNAHAQKDVHLYTAAGAATAKKIQSADNQQFIECDDPKEIATIKLGGIDAGNQQFLDWILATADRMAGNVTAKMGLGAQAPTAAQEQMIQGAVNGVEANMAKRVQEGVTSLVRDLGYLLWADKFRIIPGRLDIPGAEGYSYDATWTPDDRLGNFLDYEFDIDVSSMPYRSPQQRSQELDQKVAKYVQLMPLLAPQGGTINVAKMVEIDAELMNEPRLTEIVQFAALPTDASPEVGSSVPSSTKREYVRTSRAGAPTADAQFAESQQQWSELAQSQAV